MSDPTLPIDLPHGVEYRPLVLHEDRRGSFSEVFRSSWYPEIRPVQWNVSMSEPGVLRGMHVHPRHDDYVTVVWGRASVGLYDLRAGSPTEGRMALFELHGKEPAGVVIPHGVVHGFYFHERSLYVLGVSCYWDLSDELGCHWADPALGIPWPATSPCLSENDETLPPLSEIAGLIRPWRG